MHRTLLTFLGRGRLDINTGYKPANYKFPDDSGKKTPLRATAFFGLALAEYLNAQTVVVLGTCGSQWGVLVEHLTGESSQETDARLALIEAETAKQKVTQKMLDSVATLMTREAKRKIIPRAHRFW